MAGHAPADGRPQAPLRAAGLTGDTPRGGRRVERFDIEERWPDLFDGLDAAGRDAVVQSFASAWHEGWVPNRETYDASQQQGTLRNLLDERDAEAPRTREYVATTVRHGELVQGAVNVAPTYDAAHVRAIHRHLFGDVYAWAGQYRSVPIFRGDPGAGRV